MVTYSVVNGLLQSSLTVYIHITSKHVTSNNVMQKDAI